MSLQVIGCLAKYGLQERISDSTPSHIFVLPNANPDAPQRTVRVNRSILRKLRRLERLRPEAFLETPEPQLDWVKALSPAQYLDYMIRTQKWCRVKVHRLDETLRDRLRRVIRTLSLQGNDICLSMAMNCQALLSPD